jgi:hypothetical protein
VDDSLLCRAYVGEVNAELYAVLTQGFDLLGGNGIEDVEALSLERGHVVIDSAKGEVGTAYLAASEAKSFESLRGGDLMHEMKIDVEERGLRLLMPDDVRIPQFAEKAAGRG